LILKNQAAQQYAFIIPIVRVAAKFSKDDTGIDKQDDREGFLSPITLHINKVL
jgi:hypothetical protein